MKPPDGDRSGSTGEKTRRGGELDELLKQLGIDPKTLVKKQPSRILPCGHVLFPNRV